MRFGIPLGVLRMQTLDRVMPLLVALLTCNYSLSVNSIDRLAILALNVESAAPIYKKYPRKPNLTHVDEHKQTELMICLASLVIQPVLPHNINL